MIPKNNKNLLRHRTYVQFVVNYKYKNGVFPTVSNYLDEILPFLRLLGVNDPTKKTMIVHQLFHPIFYGMLEFDGSVITPTRMGIVFMMDIGNAFLAEETYYMFNNATFATGATGTMKTFDAVFPIRNLFSNLVKHGELTFDELNTKFYTNYNGFDVKTLPKTTKRGEPKWAYALSMMETAGLITSSGNVLNVSSKNSSYRPMDKIFPTPKLKKMFGNENIDFISQFDIDINEININKVIENAHTHAVSYGEHTGVRDGAAQASYRGLLLSRYNSECVICGISYPPLLVASHIKPHAMCNDKERFDVDNGLLLCSVHDKLFDRGLITFSKGEVVFSKILPNEDIEIIKLLPINKVDISQKNEHYLNYHRENVFKNNS